MTSPKPNIQASSCICGEPFCKFKGFCHCGCNKIPSICKKTRNKLRIKKGFPYRFCKGHTARPEPIYARPFKIEGVYCRLLELTKNQFAIVDELDYWELAKFNWIAAWARSTRSYYAQRPYRLGDGVPRTLRLNREILGLHVGDGLVGDHINRVTLDYRRKNLRVATYMENGRNRSIPTTNTSGFKGVHKRKDRKRFQVILTFEGRRIQVGTSLTPEEGAAMYIKKAKELFGEFACSG